MNLIRIVLIFSQEVLIFVVPKSTGTKEVIQKELENKLSFYIKPKVNIKYITIK